MKRLLLLLAGSAALVAVALGTYIHDHLHDGEDTSGGDS